MKDGGEVIRLELSEPLAALPAGFVLQSPARVALDLPGVINATGRSQQEVNQGNLRSVALAQAGDRTRLVLNLKQSTRYLGPVVRTPTSSARRCRRRAHLGRAAALRRQPQHRT